MWGGYSAIELFDSIDPQPTFVESNLRLRSVWEAKSVIGVVDFDMGRLKCDRVARFY